MTAHDVKRSDVRLGDVILMGDAGHLRVASAPLVQVRSYDGWCMDALRRVFVIDTERVWVGR